MIKITGKGEGHLSWQISLVKSGEYKIYAYILDDSYREELRKAKLDKNYVMKEILYHFTVLAPSFEKKMQVHVPEKSSWVFLWEYELPEGKCSVILDDTGAPG